jgi:hypothetical protein
VEVIDWPERRSEAIAANANWLWQFGRYSKIRHRGALTSFSIPDVPLDDVIWEECGDGPRSSDYLRHTLREERRAIERHARLNGCSLLINPAILLDERFVGRRARRLEILIEFLKSMPDEMVSIAIVESAVESSIILVGDWFFVSSHPPRRGGYRQSVVNWHAPTVLQELTRFDEQITAGQRASKLNPNESKSYAIDRISEMVK